MPDVAVLVVDDDSPDGTAELAERLAAELGGVDVLVRHGRRGLGSAYRDGFRRAIDAGADICVQIDADLSHDPADLPALLANVEHGADLAIGSRYVPGGRTENWSWPRRWLSRWGNRYAAGVLGLAVNDATAGYRAYRADALEAMGFETVTAEGYGFQIEMTHRLVRGRRQDRRVPDRLPRPPGGRVEAVAGHRRRGLRPRRCACGSPTGVVVGPDVDSTGDGRASSADVGLTPDR